MARPRQFTEVGFTLIELLIVVVVIAILATITTVSYFGVTDRAFDAKITNGVSQYIDAIKVYYAQNGVWPPTSGSQSGTVPGLTCLGSGYPGGNCGVVTSNPIYEDSVFNNAIASVIGSGAPTISQNAIADGTETFIGAVYGVDNVDSSLTGVPGNHGWIVDYAIKGITNDCGIKGAYVYRHSTNPNVTTCEYFFGTYNQ